MSNQIHGHDVMKMMIESGETYSRETLQAAIIKHFGEKSRFYTCSAKNMSAEELIYFLAKRGKFIETQKGFTTAANKICKH